MARGKIPVIPTDKLEFYTEQLYRQLSHMFVWEGLPKTIPKDYLERTLIREGSVLFYHDEEIGHDVLRCTVTGYNRHNYPVLARTYSPNTVGEKTIVDRKIRWLYEYDEVENDFDKTTDGVLIRNMERGQHMCDIVEHYATRLYLAQQAFDTNLLYANMPYIFQTSDEDTRLSIEKMFEEIFTGKPFIVVDKMLMQDNMDKTGKPTDIPFIAKELYDVMNEIMMDFHKTIGMKTAGVEKAERVNTLEVRSNEQYTMTVLQIMKEQREMAVEAINAFFGLDVKVSVLGEEEQATQYEDTQNQNKDSEVMTIGEFNS